MKTLTVETENETVESESKDWTYYNMGYEDGFDPTNQSYFSRRDIRAYELGEKSIVTEENYKDYQEGFTNGIEAYNELCEEIEESDEE